jgi:hypothetical protein
MFFMATLAALKIRLPSMIDFGDLVTIGLPWNDDYLASAL